jgi:hypothetical protein
MRPPRVTLALVLLAGLLPGCNLFKPAEPETGGGGSAIIANYSTPDSCLFYMRLGIEAKGSNGQEAYLGALADTTQDAVGFHAFFDPAVWSAYTGPKPQDWDLDHERQFYGAFVQVRPDPYVMQWLVDEYHPHDEIVDDDHHILHRQYLVHALVEETGESLLIAVGYADLYFTRVSASRWALTRWDDRVDPEVGAQPEDPLQQTFGMRRLSAGTGG